MFSDSRTRSGFIKTPLLFRGNRELQLVNHNIISCLANGCTCNLEVIDCRLGPGHRVSIQTFRRPAGRITIRLDSAKQTVSRHLDCGMNSALERSI